MSCTKVFIAVAASCELSMRSSFVANAVLIKHLLAKQHRCSGRTLKHCQSKRESILH